MSRLPEGASDEDARVHLTALPAHNVSVDIDDQWVCHTCEAEEEESDGPQVYSVDAMLGVVYRRDR